MKPSYKDDKWPLISVIVLNYNSRQFLELCLKSLFNTKYKNFEVVFVDNASTDGSVELINNRYGNNPNLKIIKNSDNLGFAKGNNVGVKHSRGDYIVFLNPDTQVHPNWLKQLIKTMQSDQTIGAAQSKLLLAQNGNRLESTGHFIDYCGIESLESTQITGQMDSNQHNKINDIFYARGAAMIVKRKVLEEVGLFDHVYFTDHEEIDLCWRIRLKGYRIVCVPTSIVYHARSGASWQARKQKPAWLLFHLRKNHIASLIKNYELRNVIKYLLRYLIYLLLHAIYKMSKRDINTPAAYYKAILWNILKFRYIYSQRQKVQHTIRKVPDEDIMKHMRKPRIPWHFLS